MARSKIIRILLQIQIFMSRLVIPKFRLLTYGVISTFKPLISHPIFTLVNNLDADQPMPSFVDGWWHTELNRFKWASRATSFFSPSVFPLLDSVRIYEEKALRQIWARAHGWWDTRIKSICACRKNSGISCWDIRTKNRKHMKNFLICYILSQIYLHVSSNSNEHYHYKCIAFALRYAFDHQLHHSSLNTHTKIINPWLTHISL